MLNALVSIIIPSYNHENYVKDSIESVINQTYKNIELIIIDDGSKDNSVQKINELVDLCHKRFVRFKFIHRENIGLTKTLNEALNWCEGVYLCILASDDIYLPKKVEKQVDFLNVNLEYVGVTSNICQIDSDNNVIGGKKVKSRSYNFQDIFFSKYYLPAPAAMLRIDFVKKVGGYSEKTLLEDLYMWLKISVYGSVFLMTEELVYYRRHESNLSANFILMCEERYKLIDLYRDNKDYRKANLMVGWLNLKGSRFHGFININKMLLNFLLDLIKFFKK